jgi:class 3 adenylate cyclase
VNIAARVQSLAGPHEILCTNPVYDAPGAAALVSRSRLHAERNEAALKGIAGSVPVIRLQATA